MCFYNKNNHNSLNSFYGIRAIISNEYFFFPFIFCNMAAIYTSTIDSPITTINTVTTINKKLTPSTFSQWRAQFEALLIDYDFIDFFTGAKKSPAIDTTNSVVSKAANSHWFAKTNSSSMPFLPPPPQLSPNFLLHTKHLMKLVLMALNIILFLLTTILNTHSSIL